MTFEAIRGIVPGVMVRPIGVEYATAVYHVTACGRSASFVLNRSCVFRERNGIASVGVKCQVSRVAPPCPSVARGQRCGEGDWVKQTAKRLGLRSALRPRGRPKKQEDKAYPAAEKRESNLFRLIARCDW